MILYSELCSTNMKIQESSASCLCDCNEVVVFYKCVYIIGEWGDQVTSTTWNEDTLWFRSFLSRLKTVLVERTALYHVVLFFWALHTHLYVKMLGASRWANCVIHRADLVNEELPNHLNVLGYHLTQFPNKKASEVASMSHWVWRHANINKKKQWLDEEIPPSLPCSQMAFTAALAQKKELSSVLGTITIVGVVGVGFIFYHAEVVPLWGA